MRNEMYMSRTRRFFRLKIGCVLVVWCLGLSANAATINSTAGDAAGKSSFFTGEIFGGPPTAGNDYVMIQSRLLRTPDFAAKAATNLVFQGDSLSIGNATWTAGQFALKTVYTDDSKRAVVTINDFRLYNSVVNMASEGKGCIAGNITVYGTPTYPAKFQCSTAGKRLFEIASTITGATGTKILFEKATDTSELRMTGDMSGYLGALETTAAGGRLVLACPYASLAGAEFLVRRHGYDGPVVRHALRGRLRRGGGDDRSRNP